jgi:hypothetical protein
MENINFINNALKAGFYSIRTVLSANIKWNDVILNYNSIILILSCHNL